MTELRYKQHVFVIRKLWYKSSKYTVHEGRLTVDRSCPEAIFYVQNLIKKHIKIAAYDSKPVILPKPPLSTVSRPPSGILIEYLSRTHAKGRTEKSVKSLNPCPSVIQTVYDIIKTYGSELKVESIEGQGTTFTIQLPKTGSV